MRKIIGIVCIIFSIISCGTDIKTDLDLMGIDAQVKVDRFEQKFYKANKQTISALKSEYPFLFPNQTPDSIWLSKINSSEELELLKISQENFKDFESESLQLEDLFKHIKYYHPVFKEPKVITLITNLDYENRVMYADSLLFISLDMYFGAKSPVYHDFPIYLSNNFDKKQLIVDVSNAIGERFMTYNRNRQFIHLMIAEGKKIYQSERYLPSCTDSQLMGYTDDEISWVSANESQLWKYFIENSLLYSTDYQLVSRFIEDAPFSKFYINIDKESPGRIGVWLGWQIVQSYMKNNNVTLQQLLKESEENIFLKSKYKPKK